MSRVQVNSEELVIYSKDDFLNNIENFLNTLFSNFRINKSKFSRLLLCISEGVLNAIEHGNNNEQGKVVKLKVSTDGSLVWITIKDEGQGFNYIDIPNPIENENLKKEKGRGLFIINSYAEEIEFKNNGNTLMIKFNLSGN